MIENLTDATSERELADIEERASKARAAELFDSGALDEVEAGTFAGLAAIHRALFQDVYPFAGHARDVNISKGSFRFASALYLPEALAAIDRMPWRDFDEIVEKYVEMNVAHPFREGNGRSMRIWLDVMLKRRLGRAVDWSAVDKQDYLLAMERSPIKDVEIKHVLKAALVPDGDDRALYMKGVDASYAYEGYSTYSTADLAPGEASAR